jgi:D-glycero-D-manno-heptose 1,7-bisphosphate phosphatase
MKLRKSWKMNKAIFLDRDGTLNDDTMYPHKIKHFKLLPGVIEGLKRLSYDYIFIIITNQSGIGRGKFTEQDFQSFNNHLVGTLKKEGIEIKKTYHCPHHPDDNCECRKPNPKNIRLAAKEFDIDIDKSWMIGDHPPDIKVGLNAGTRTIFMLTGHGKQHLEEVKPLNPDFIAENFLQAADYVISNKD